jgi:hypothetical protein
MLTRHKGQLKLKDWPSRSPGDRRCARPASLWRVASQSSCMRCCGTKLSSRRLKTSIHQTGDRIELPRGATPEGGSRRRRGLRCMRSIAGRLRFQPSRPAPSLPHQVPNEHAENTGTRKRRPPEEPPVLDPLENTIRRDQTSRASMTLSGMRPTATFPPAISDDGMDGARTESVSLKGRAKMVVVGATVLRSAVHGKVYHRFVLCRDHWGRSGQARLSSSRR